MMRLTALSVVTLVAAIALGSVAHAQWTTGAPLAIPENNYSFLASTPRGDLLAATFNNGPTDQPAKDLPALLIRNPASPTPEVLELCRTSFAPQRGYGGIACDAEGNFYVSGDTGEPASCFLRKFHENGAPDTSFGIAGEMKPGRRCLGLEVLGRHLLMAVDWGEILVLDAATGRQLGLVAKPPELHYVRDIAMDPKSLRIFGVAKGSAVTWGGGTPWDPGAYRFRQISQSYGELRSGEGISIDPILRCLLITPIPGSTLLEVEGTGNIRRTAINSARPDTHLADTVMSFDGTRLYISDVKYRRIHVMTRPYPTGAVAVASAAAPGTKAPTTGVGNAADVRWNTSYTEVLEQARRAGKPMIVYFRHDSVPRCREFETGVLLTDDFKRRAAGYVCVFEDAAKSPQLAAAFGAQRVPYVAILDRAGEHRAVFAFDINPQSLFDAMEANK